MEFDGHFDAAILSNPLEHSKNRAEFLRLLVKIVDSGRVLLRIPLFERDWRVPMENELNVEYRLDPTYYTEYALESFAYEVQQAGLRVTHKEIR